MKRTLHILFAALAAMILLPATMMAYNVEPGVHYTISDGTLTIRGDGPMDDYATYGECPWYEAISSGEVTEIFIDEGITHIGNYAFYNCSCLHSTPCRYKYVN